MDTRKLEWASNFIYAIASLEIVDHFIWDVLSPQGSTFLDASPTNFGGRNIILIFTTLLFLSIAYLIRKGKGIRILQAVMTFLLLFVIFVEPASISARLAANFSAGVCDLVESGICITLIVFAIVMSGDARRSVSL